MSNLKSQMANSTLLLLGIVMGSDSDLPTIQATADVCAQFGVPHEVRIISAHRTPDDMAEYGKTAHTYGLKVIICGAGGAAHLPGMLAAYSPLPVIDVPVATVAIGNVKNAGLLGVQMLAAHDGARLQKVLDSKAELAAQSRAKNAM